MTGQIYRFPTLINWPKSANFRQFLAAQTDPFRKTTDFLKNPNIKPSTKTKNLSVLLTKTETLQRIQGILYFSSEQFDIGER